MKALFQLLGITPPETSQAAATSTAPPQKKTETPPPIEKRQADDPNVVALNSAKPEDTAPNPPAAQVEPGADAETNSLLKNVMALVNAAGKTVDDLLPAMLKANPASAQKIATAFKAAAATA